MRQIPSAGPDHDELVGLPAVVEQQLIDVVADGFTLYCCGPKTAPNALVAAYHWDHHVDLLTIGDFTRVIAARVPTHGPVDIFAPQVVVWAYEGPPHQALPALLDLVHPAHPNAPTTSHPAPPSLHIPRAQQRPMTIQPPAPNHAGTRAARLATAMTIPSGDRATLGCLVGRTISGWPLVEQAAPDAKLPAASRSPHLPQ